MGCILVGLFFLRFNTLLLSLGVLALHVGNLVLLAQENGTGDWWPSYTPYILYYVGPIVSILSVVILLILSCMSARKSLLGDRVLSIINLLLFIAIVVYNTLEAGTVPWTGALPNKQFTAPDTKGWANYCPNYTDQGIMIRCWMQNGAWLGMIATGFMWLVLALYSIISRNSDVYNDEYDDYDYKEDVPMAAQRSTSPVISKQQPQQQSYFVPPVATAAATSSHNSTPPISQHQQPEEAYYYQARPQQYDSSNLNPEYYLQNNPIQEEDQNNQYAYNVGGGGDDAFERSRKTSKTFLEGERGEELGGATANHSSGISPAESSSVQPPHSYGGGSH